MRDITGNRCLEEIIKKSYWIALPKWIYMY